MLLILGPLFNYKILGVEFLTRFLIFWFNIAVKWSIEIVSRQILKPTFSRYDESPFLPRSCWQEPDRLLFVHDFQYSRHVSSTGIFNVNSFQRKKVIQWSMEMDHKRVDSSALWRIVLPPRRIRRITITGSDQERFTINFGKKQAILTRPRVAYLKSIQLPRFQRCTKFLIFALLLQLHSLNQGQGIIFCFGNVRNRLSA